MKRRHFVFGSVGAIGGASLLAGSGAFSRTESQREVQFEVVGEEDAYLRLEYADDLEVECTGTFEITVQNRFKEPVDLRITFEVAHNKLSPEESRQRFDEVDIGEERTATFELTCEPSEHIDTFASVNVVAVGLETKAIVNPTRQVDLTCVCPNPVSWISFCGENLFDHHFSDVVGDITDPHEGTIELNWNRTGGNLTRVVLYEGSFGNRFGHKMWEFDAADYGLTGESVTTVVSLAAEDGEPIETEDTTDGGRHPSAPCPDGECGPKFDATDDGFESVGHHDSCTTSNGDGEADDSQ